MDHRIHIHELSSPGLVVDAEIDRRDVRVPPRIQAQELQADIQRGEVGSQLATNAPSGPGDENNFHELFVSWACQAMRSSRSRAMESSTLAMPLIPSSSFF